MSSMECVECLKENKKYIIGKNVKWDFPAYLVYEGNSYCRKHLYKKLKWKFKEEEWERKLK